VDDFRKQGFLPQAMRNYLLLLGWRSRNSTEMYVTVKDMVDDFLMSGLSKAPCVFNLQKLAWFHRMHMKKQGFKNITNSVLETAVSATPPLLRDFASLSDEEILRMQQLCAPMEGTDKLQPRELYDACLRRFASVLTSICVHNESAKNPFMVTNETLRTACAAVAAYPLEDTLRTDTGALMIDSISPWLMCVFVFVFVSIQMHKLW
jgi:glutamyl/glutaminyl-tRNA synthetase